MAGTLRVVVEAVEKLQLQSNDGFWQLMQKNCSQRRPVTLEVVSDDIVSKARRFEVDEDGSAEMHEVIFVPAPQKGKSLVLRAKTLKDSKDILVGEAEFRADSSGKLRLGLQKGGRTQGAVRLMISDGLPEAPPGPPMPNTPAATRLVPSPRGPPGAEASPSAVAPSPALSSAASTYAKALPPSSAAAWAPGHAQAAASPANTQYVKQHSNESQATSQHWSPESQHRASPGYQHNPRQSPQPSPRPGAPAAAPAAQSRGGPPPPPPPSAPQPYRALRRRHPEIPTLGACTVTLEAVDGLGQPLAAPHLVIGLEGQEFRTGLDATLPLAYEFEFASIMQDIQIYCYDDRLRQGPVGRILLPVSSVVWPVGALPSIDLVSSVFENSRRFKRKFVCQFAPASARGDGFGDFSFVDRFEPASIGQTRGPAATVQPFGSVHVHVELMLRPDVPSLAHFYSKTVGATFSMLNMDSTVLSQPLPLMHKADIPAEEARAEADVRSLLESLIRLRIFINGTGGWSSLFTWLAKEKWRTYAAAALWFVFCKAGYFPPPLWLWPLYIWVAFATSGLLSQNVRSKATSANVPAALVPAGLLASNFDLLPDKERQALLRYYVAEQEPFLRSLVAGLERCRTILSFGDGPASVVVFAAAGCFALLMSFSFFLITCLETVSFICGLYGAFFLAMTVPKLYGETGAKMGAGPEAPLLQNVAAQGGEARLPDFMMIRKLGMALEACVPNEAELAHKGVASRYLQEEELPQASSGGSLTRASTFLEGAYSPATAPSETNGGRQQRQSTGPAAGMRPPQDYRGHYQLPS
eukprot:TRINITY_DN9512_c0_g1_i1.p1 TRINITY_DN9512_c0_g1~~TRINITY_DN9512_c0_g1_i1.p1  ORF type:complete len:810 (-),score=134.75 TRINITY_DN9512_c0_g1_i1:20-2449(-)